jgi:hypothetical protein
MNRPIHKPHPNGQAHPFKALTLCGRMVRFGGFEILGDEEGDGPRPATCKPCLTISERVCPACHGTGLRVKGEPAALPQAKPEECQA